MDLRERFEGKFTPEPNSGCWLWMAAGGADGRYGRIGVNGNSRLAHRVAWELYRGPISGNEHVLHKCDVTICVNPDHLFLGSHADNMRDMAEKGRAVGLSGVNHPR